MKEGGNYKAVFCIFTAVAVTVAVVIAVIVAVIVTRETDNDSNETQNSEVSYMLHVNPADPVILSAETPEGDLISMLGNKSASGEPQSIDEFIVENEADGLTFVFMNEDGTIGSAQASDGQQLDFIWDENETTVYTSIVINNGSQQLSIKINFSEPVDEENFTNFLAEFDNDVRSKRSLSDFKFRPTRPTKSSDGPKTRVKRQSNTQTAPHASVFVNVQSCDGPESNAEVFADVLLNYDQSSGDYEDEVVYWGEISSNPGEYEIRIPTSKASTIGENIGNVCEKITMVLDKVCGYYSTINKWTRRVTRHGADSLVCFKLGLGLQVFTGTPLLVTYRFCRNVFKPLNAYCNSKFTQDIPSTDTSVIDLICENIPLLDNGIDFFRDMDILFTPTAIIPPGILVQGTGQVLSIQPGMSIVNQQFTIVADDQQLRITSFIITPPDPMPLEDYVASATYSCYSSSTFFANMSIIGTDNYTDHTICYTGPTCRLYVPGAEALVRDDVQIYIENGQTTTSRTVVVIF